MFFFFSNDTATTEIYTLSLHDALPIYKEDAIRHRDPDHHQHTHQRGDAEALPGRQDRKSTRLNSSHANISYAVFCLKKKKKENHTMPDLITPLTIHIVLLSVVSTVPSR